MAKADYFLTITKQDGSKVEGEAGDSQYRRALELESFSWGEDNETSIGSATGGAGAGKVKFQKFTFRMKANVATPPLVLALACGMHFKEMQLVVRKAGSTQQPFQTVTFSTVFVTKYTQVGDANSIVPLDSFECAYGIFTLSYAEQKADGTLGAANKVGWNQMQNIKV